MSTRLTSTGRPTDPGGLGVLSLEECELLLADHYVGRIAVIIGGRPQIFPMNYRYASGVLVLRTRPGTKLAGLANGTPIAFEIDGIDEAYRSGWSVVVQGESEMVPEEAVADVVRHRPLRSWARGERDLWIRVSPAVVSGRVIN